MGRIKSQEGLRKAIDQLELKRIVQEVQIKNEFEQIKETLRPQNIVKNTFSRLAEIPEVKKTMISTAIGLGLGYFSKKVKDVMSEESLDNLVNSVVNTELKKLNRSHPESFLNRAINYYRTHLKEDSPLYPFIGIKQ